MHDPALPYFVLLELLVDCGLERSEVVVENQTNLVKIWIVSKYG